MRELKCTKNTDVTKHNDIIDTGQERYGRVTNKCWAASIQNLECLLLVLNVSWCLKVVG